MLILTIIFLDRLSANIIAFTLPLFSFLLSGHPIYPKVIIVAVELITFVFLFYNLKKNIGSTFWAMLLSIIISKTIYYGLKYLLIEMTLLQSAIISTPIGIQIFLVLFYSSIFLIPRFREIK